MKLKVTVNDVAYDVDVDVDKTPNAPLAPIMFGGGSGPALKASAGGGGKAGAGEVPAPLAGGRRRQGWRRPPHPGGHEDGD